jgi:hypothetical protein
MNVERLAELLASADVALAETTDLTRVRRAIDATAGGAAPHADVQRLLEGLKAEPELRIFDGRLHARPGGAHLIEYPVLATYMIERARAVGPQAAVGNLVQYVNATEIPISHVLVVAGTTPAEPCELGRGLRFIPWADLAGHRHKEVIEERYGAPNLFPRQMAAIMQDSAFPRRDFSQDEYARLGRAPVAEADVSEEMQIAALCLALVTPSPMELLAVWSTLPDWTPLVGGGMQIMPVERSTRPVRVTAQQCSVARELLEAFYRLPSNTQSLMRLVLERLNTAMRRQNSVDAAIDLGIVLEAMFFSDDQGGSGELTFRLKLRAARLLETEKAMRKTMFDLVGDLYTLRSKAAHTGRVPERIGQRSILDLIQEGYQVAARAARLFITKGAPDWKDVIFS